MISDMNLNSADINNLVDRAIVLEWTRWFSAILSQRSFFARTIVAWWSANYVDVSFFFFFDPSPVLPSVFLSFGYFVALPLDRKRWCSYASPARQDSSLVIFISLLFSVYSIYVMFRYILFFANALIRLHLLYDFLMFFLLYSCFSSDMPQ